MFEITFKDGYKLQELICKEKRFGGAEYDFTFEDRYLIFHYIASNELHYIAADVTSGKTSIVTRRKLAKPLRKSDYPTIIKDIIFSIKYTGDARHIGISRNNPLDIIDFIFWVVLPKSGYHVREEQIRLSKQMYQGLTERRVALCEAEVGTGKSLAYLVAGIVAKKYNPLFAHMPITIATSSIELQKALINREIPELSYILKECGIIDEPITAVLRKGKEHYFCKKRFEEHLEDIKKHGKKYSGLIRKYNDMKISSALDLDKFNLSLSVKEKICVSGSCFRCKFKDECGYADFIRQARETGRFDFQVTNHNLYLNSLYFNGSEKVEILKHSELIIIDEAHKLKDAAQDCFGARISFDKISNYISFAEQKTKDFEKNPKRKELIEKIKKLNKSFFEELKNLYKNAERETFINISNSMVSKLENLIESLTELDLLLPDFSNTKSHTFNLIREISVFTRIDNINIWIESDMGKLELCCTPRNIGELLYNFVWSRERRHVLTSGTMSDGADFEFFISENGLDRISGNLITTSSINSPFDFAKNTRLYIPSGMPIPNINDEGYRKAVAEHILEIVDATNGHTAILFTSYKLLSSVYELIRDRLTRYEVICMSRSNKNAINDFKKSKNAVLFAAGSMWEGVDCKGDTLSSVIIPRLPFPLRSASLEQKKDECEDISEFVQKYAMPEMLIKLKQGAGRLIRCESDTGLVSILDSRAEKDSYRSRIHTALKNYPEVNAIYEVRDFFKEVKSEEYFKS